MTLLIDPTARVSRLADIEDSIRGTRIVIGPNVVIDSFVKIKPAGGNGDLVIGENTVINSGTVIYTGGGISIGRNVAVAAGCVLAPVNHKYRARDRLIREQGFDTSKGGIQIGDDVWIGAGTVVLDGALLKRGSVVGSMSLVRGILEEYFVYAGNPLRLIGERS